MVDHSHKWLTIYEYVFAFLFVCVCAGRHTKMCVCVSSKSHLPNFTFSPTTVKGVWSCHCNVFECLMNVTYHLKLHLRRVIFLITKTQIWGVFSHCFPNREVDGKMIWFMCGLS